MSRMIWIIATGAALLITAIVAWWLIAGREQEADDGAVFEEMEAAQRYRAGDFHVALALDPATPRTGSNRLLIRLTDEQGRPVTGADIEAVARMPAMGAMAEMRAPLDIEELGGGRYAGEFNLPMEGSWPITLELSHPRLGEERLTFEMATGRAGLELASGAQVLDDRAMEGMGDMNGMERAARYQAGNFHVELALDPAAPRTGNNQLLITLTDEQGRPVTGADIEAVARMPAMGAMQEMRSPLDIEELGGGRYRGEFSLSMEGSWPLTLELSHPRLGEERLTFEMATGRAGLELASGGRVLDGMDGLDQQQAAAPTGETLGPAITIDARRRQLIGVQTGEAERRHLVRDIVAPGVIAWDETGFHDISLRVDAWVGDLHADFTGMAVQAGDVLFTVYGPELLAAQQDYLAAYRSESRQAFGSDSLLQAARKRLELWGVTDQQLRDLEQRGEPLDYLPVLAPRDGIIVEKSVVAGSAVQAGQSLLRIADLSTVWVEAQIYDADLPLMRTGMPARVRLPYLPAREFDSEIDYIYPSFQQGSRTARVRLSLANPDAVLKPAMYADVLLQADLGERLVVPDSAVLIAGRMRVVFVDQGGGRLQPVSVETGQQVGDFVEILEGLSAGDRVVTSGTFLVASESRLRGGLQQW